jgi:hypothetical protein
MPQEDVVTYFISWHSFVGLRKTMKTLSRCSCFPATSRTKNVPNAVTRFASVLTVRHVFGSYPVRTSDRLPTTVIVCFRLLHLFWPVPGHEIGHYRLLINPYLFIIHLAYAVRTLPPPPTISYPMGKGGTSLGIKREEREADHPPPSSAEFKNAWSYTSTPSYVFIAWYLVKHRINFEN